MKPLPSSDMSEKSTSPVRGALLPSLSLGDAIPSNQRRSANPVRHVYPWLLLASTTIATVFCILYITKPVIEPRV
jgi:p-aminobenzoyl-glutamate transporter AbgT